MSSSWSPYLDHLRQLPFVKDVGVTPDGGEATPEGFDSVLRIRTPRRSYELPLVVKRTHLTRALLNGVAAQATQTLRRPWVLFAPHIGRPLGKHLATLEINYLDRAGNCHLQLGQDYMAVIEGRRQAEEPRGRGLGRAGYQAIFAILAWPELLDAPVRTLARAAGTSKNTAARTVARLIEEGLVGPGTKRHVLLNGQALLDRWLTGYATMVRPRLLVGTFRTPDIDPEGLDSLVPAAFTEEEAWAWGGGAAAMRLTGSYRGPTTVLHVAEWRKEHAFRLRAVRAIDGALTVLRVPGEIALQGVVARTVHPLLVYSELLTGDDERAREAADEIRRRYLQT